MKVDLKPLLNQLSGLNPYQQNQELEILKFWFLDFLNSIEGIDKVVSTYNQNPWSFYQFSFEFNGVQFRAMTDGKNQIVIRDRNQDYYLHFQGDHHSNYFKLALAMAFSLKQNGKI
jgi:hypothetical protein